MCPQLELRKFVSPEFIFGDGAHLFAGTYAENLAARKVLIVTDPGIKKTGMVDELCGILNNKDLEYEIFSNVTSNPRDKEVMEGAQVFYSAECNLIIALGGGSPMDCAKGIGIVSSNKKHILDFKGVDKVPAPSPPLICIPTTAGSSADVSQFAIILDTQKKLKIAIISKALVPDVALIDPSTTLTMDQNLTASSGLDALVHSIEAYTSNASSQITDLHALDSIKLISNNLEPLLNDLQNLDLRSEMMMGSLEAGLAFSNASLGLIHAMAHSLGGLLDLSHGECNALLLEHVIDFNFPSQPDKYLKMGEVMGIDFKGLDNDGKKESFINYLKDLKKACGMDNNLNVGITDKEISELAANTIKDPCIVTNPRLPSVENIVEIFKNAL
jgi:alcohol dehydrogenase class IV